MPTPHIASQTSASFGTSMAEDISASRWPVRWLRAVLGLAGRRGGQRGTCASLNGMDDALLRDIGRTPAPRSSRSNLDRAISLFQL